MRKFTLVCSLAFLGLALSACNAASLPVSTSYTEEELKDLGGQIESPWEDYVVPASMASFPESELSIVLEKGSTFTYHPTLTPSYLDVSSLIWKSSDENIISVANGVVTANNGGSASITVSSKNEEFAQINLNVEVKVTLQDFAITNNVLDLGFGESVQLIEQYTPSDTTQKGLSYTSLNENIATVSETGEVTAGDQAGDTTIRVSSDYINTAKEVSVHVEDKVIHVANVEITNEIDKLEVDKTYKVAYKVSPDDTEEKAVTFSSSDESVATITEEGLISALEIGTTTIKVTSSVDSSKEDSFELEVFAITAASVEFESLSIELAPNGSTQLHPIYKNDLDEIITPSRTKPTYVSSDTSVATVSTAGLISARNIGETDITFTDGALVEVIHVEVKIFQAVFTATDLPDWITSDGCVIFAWIWGGSASSGQWQELEFNLDGTEAHFTFNDDITGMLLVRCVAGTTTPDWTIESGDEPGRIYNKTSDVSIYSGVTSYALPDESWVEFPEVIVDPTGATYYLVGTHNEWVTSKSSMMSYDSTVEGHYYVNNLKLDSGNKLKVTDGNGGWFTCSKTWDDCGFTLDDEGNVVVSNNGTYTVHFYVNGTNDNHIVLEKTGDEPTPPAPTGIENIKFVFGTGGDEVEVELNETTANLTDEAQKFEKDGVSVTKDTPFEIFVDDVKLTKDYSPDSDDTKSEPAKYNNYMGNSVEGFTVQATNASAEIAVHVWESGWITFWISGGDSATHDVELEEGFYIYSTVNNWTLLAAYKMTQDGENPTLYHYEGLVLEADDEFLVTNKEKSEWYKQNDNNIKPGAGTYDVTLDVSKVPGNSVTFVKQGDEPVVTYDVKFNLDATQFDSWEGTTKDYSLYLYGDSGEILGTFDGVKGNLNSGSLTAQVVEGKKITLAVFYLTETKAEVDSRKQTVDIALDIAAEGEYDIDFADLDWDGEGKMTGVKFVVHGDEPEPPVADTYKVTIGENEYTLVLDSTAEHTGEYADRIAAYTVAIPSVTKDEVVTFTKNDVAFALVTASGDDNNIIGNNTDGFAIRETLAEEKTLYFNVWKENAQHENWASVYLQGPEIEKYDVKFNLDATQFDSWEGTTKDYSLYLYGDSGEILGTFDGVKGNLNSGSLTAQVVEGKKITLAVFYLTETKAEVDSRKQTVDIALDIAAEGEYDIDFADLDWDGEGKMTGVKFVVHGGEPEPETKYTVTFEIDLSNFAAWDPAVSDYSLYLFGEGYSNGTFDGVRANLNSGTLEVEVPTGKSITGLVFYFYQDGVRKQSIDIEVSISAVGTYTINVSAIGWEKVSDDPEVWKMNNITIVPKE